MKFTCFLLSLFITSTLLAQDFYFGADMSYVNEMEDCGVVYKEAQTTQDPYTIFQKHGCNLVRLRLWHSPAWYDDLNDGKRYSDLPDVKRAIARAKQQNMNVLLDFHLSDNWADPSKQLVPAAWLPVVDDTNLLKDSLYNYIFETLEELQAENLVPEFIQIGNETNKGILLSPEDNATWTLDWLRNATLFNHAIRAVRDFEEEYNEAIKIVLHLADPSHAEALVQDFTRYGVRDFDIIGMSYYWAWHKPTSIEETGKVIAQLQQDYPDKQVLIVETGYIWTTASNDAANNIISEVHPDYSPATPINQRDWLIALTQEVIKNDGLGVIYWEPAWVSSRCSTQWGRGSHQEHATFFDFDNQLLLPGGIEWMQYPYTTLSNTTTPQAKSVQFFINNQAGEIRILQSKHANMNYELSDTLGHRLLSGKSDRLETILLLNALPFGMYVLSVELEGQQRQAQQFIYGKN